METLKGCTGCKTCEIMCSYHFLQKFQPSQSAIRVRDVGDGFAVEFYAVETPEGHFSCDFCEGLDERQCVKYCNTLKCKDGLEKLISGIEGDVAGKGDA